MSATKGQKYHVMLENNHSDPVLNFASINWGYTRTTPRSTSPVGPWSSYWDQEVVWLGTRPAGTIDSVSDIEAYDVDESSRHQPAYMLKIDPTNGDPIVYSGPLNLLSNNLLEPQSSTGDTASGTGGVYEITASQLLRTTFKVDRAMTIQHARLVPMVYGPSGDISVMTANLRRHNGTVRGALLGSAQYTTADGSTLQVGASYSPNPLTTQVAPGMVTDAMLIIQRDFSDAVALNTTDTYYLEFVRTFGSSTWLIPVAVDEKAAGQSPELDVPVWDGWTPTSALQASNQAEWSSNTGSSWVRCSIYGSSQSISYDVRARLVA